jgi:hypothetical protein
MSIVQRVMIFVAPVCGIWWSDGLCKFNFINITSSLSLSVALLTSLFSSRIHSHHPLSLLFLGLSLLFLGRWSNVNQFAAPFFSENSL